MVPRIIHLIWFGPMTERVRRICRQHCELNPQHDVRLHTTSTELHDAYRYAFDHWAHLPQLKSDLLRWSLLEQYGGWYFDIDVVPKSPVANIERDLELDGSLMLLTKRDNIVNNDIIAVGSEWPHWHAVHEYLDTYEPARRPEVENGQAIWYSAYSWDVILRCIIRGDGRDHERWTLGPDDRFSPQHPQPYAVRSRDLPAKPSTKRRIEEWSNALRRWTEAGKPVRSDDEVARINAEHCEPCDHYDSKWRQCKLCGCFCRKRGAAQFNKPKMLTERCPIGKWGDDAVGKAALPSVTFTAPMDVVYPLASGHIGKRKHGSKWDNNELRYSLRSLQQYLKHMGRVFIVTEHLPEWLTNVEHIKAKDVHRHNKDANLIDKVMLACKLGVSSTFMRISDDQCLLQPWNGLDVWHMGEASRDSGGKWWRRCQHTCDYLKGLGRPTYFYDCHAPTPVDRDTFIAVASEADYQTRPGMCINTLYFNSVDVPRQHMGHRKVAFHRPCKLRQIRKKSKKALFFGYSEAGTNDAMKTFLERRFPEPSRFEK